MPRATKAGSSTRSTAHGPYQTAPTAEARQAAIWTTEDDRILLKARAAGLNWQPISAEYFPNKTGNACRKRHERLMERRHGNEWDVERLDTLAREYVMMRQDIWEPLAERLGEKWSVVEAKCMERGLKNLQSLARTAERKLGIRRDSFDDEQGPPDHHSDSGVGLGSDAETETCLAAASSVELPGLRTAHDRSQQQDIHPHIRSRSLPQPLPPLRLYCPPPPIRRSTERPLTVSPAVMAFGQRPFSSRSTPDSQTGRCGFSIQSVLAPQGSRIHERA